MFKNMFNGKSGFASMAIVLPLAFGLAACERAPMADDARAYLANVPAEGKIELPQIKNAQKRADFVDLMVRHGALRHEHLRDEALRVLIAMKDDPSPEVRVQVAQGLGRIDPVEPGPSVDERIEALQHIARNSADSEEVRFWVADAFETMAQGPRLGEFSAEAGKCMKAALPMLGDPSPMVRAGAIRVVGGLAAKAGMSPAETFETIAAYKNDESPMVRTAVVSMADYIAGSRDEVSAEAVLELFTGMKNDPDARVRAVALNFSGVLRKQPDLAPKVMQAFEDMLAAELAREQPMEDALVFIPGGAANVARADASLAERAWNIIDKLQFNEHKQVRFMTAHAIEEMGYVSPEQANKAVAQALEMVGDTAYWTAAKEAVSTIGKLTHDDYMNADPQKVLAALREARTIIEGKTWEVRYIPGMGELDEKQAMLESVDFWIENTESIIARQKAASPEPVPPPAP